MAHSLPVFPKFEVNGDSASRGHNKLTNLFVAMNIDSHKRTKALLLHYAGDEVFEINGTLDNTGDEMARCKKQNLTNYFKPKAITEF